MIRHLTKENFDETIVEGVTLVDFWADWCGPCRMIAPAIEELARKAEGRYKVCKVNVDEETELAARFGVMSIPTIILFKGGAELDKRVGVLSTEELERMLTGAIHT